MRTAAIYSNKKRIFIHSYSKTKAGFAVASAPFFKLDSTVSSMELIGAIKSALENYKENVPNPDFSQLNRIIAESFELKSSSALDKPNIKYCNITLKEKDILLFMPTKHASPPDKGHLHKPDESVSISYSSTDEKIVEALQLAFSKCE